MDDRDGGVVGEEKDRGAAVSDADAEVVRAAGAAEADLSVGADVVVADPVVGVVAESGVTGF